MLPGSTNPCFPSGAPGISIYGLSQDVVSSNIDQGGTNSSSAVAAVAISDTHPNPSNFLYNLSVLKDKVHQAQSLASMFISSDHIHTQQLPQSTAIAIASMGTVIQEIIITASSLMFTCQQISLGVGGTPPSGNNTNDNNHPSANTPTANHLHHQFHQHHRLKLASGRTLNQQNGGRNGDSHFGDERGEGFYTNNDVLDWYGESYNTNENTTTRTSSITVGAHNGVGRGDLLAQKGVNNEGLEQISPKDYDIVELDAADLLAKYTHYCQICGKGFKRDANLRMHMRAHGDEYKSSAALSNPIKNSLAANGKEGLPRLPRKYSCPHEGCRWNRKHAKFQPLKSMICVKNHYKRSHCPKMYVCKRCNRKQFSVLSDLRTHEKHCGDLKWQCSCGTTFSRKDKLLGHVTLFIGHTPAISSLAKMGKVD